MKTTTTTQDTYEQGVKQIIESLAAKSEYARLISAAPDLLEAAEVIMSSITLLNLMNHFPVSTTCKLAKAIAKAKGQQ